MLLPKKLNILGTRGIPAAHGGFETFAAHLAPYLRDRGWDVTIYCQGDFGPGDGAERRTSEDEWEGIRRVFFTPRRSGAAGTIEFDWLATKHAIRQRRGAIDLVLGYNTAVFAAWQRASGKRVVMNMDGVEWRRAKWPMMAKAWFFVNEGIGAWTSHRTIADHPEIGRHLGKWGRSKVDVIAYGSDRVAKCSADPLRTLALSSQGYFVSIARVEPENSILEIVQAFCSRPRPLKLVVLGTLLPETNSYHRRVIGAANRDVIFPGAIYDKAVVSALRWHCRAYVHGHQVGGTNPSLVEALGAGNAVIAHDNKYNRWTAGDSQLFFRSVEDCAAAMTVLEEQAERLEQARSGALARHASEFTWERILGKYEHVLDQEWHKLAGAQAVEPSPA